MVGAITPQTLTEALSICRGESVIPFAGGTDLMVRRRSWSGTRPNFEQPALFIGGLAELQSITVHNGVLKIGAAATLTSVFEHETAPQILKRAIIEMASPAIRNAGTLGGNICNASPAADTLSPLYALGASVLLQNASETREVPITEFITGPGKTVLNDDELLTAVHIPLNRFDAVYYRKVGTRKADALSKVSFAGLAGINDGRVEDIRIALGAVAPKVVRNPKAEGLLVGRAIGEIPLLIEDVKAIYEKDIRPIDDQRSSADYRRTVALRLIADFLGQVKEIITNT